MEENNQPIVDEKSDQGAVQDSEAGPSVASVATDKETFAPAAEIKEPTRFQVFMRRLFTWLAVVAIAYLGGFITSYVTNYQPKVEELALSEAALEDAQDEIKDLNAEINLVTGQRDALETADQYRTLLAIMADTYSARLAMVQENTAAAKSALSDTPDKLDEIIEVIRLFDANLAESLPQRLTLIRTNIDGNLENAIADCDLLLKDLRDIEKALYQ